MINDIRFKGKRQIDWNDIKRYLEGYVGDYYEIEENAERIYIGNELPEEYTESESRKSLMGANAKAKANAATAIPYFGSKKRNEQAVTRCTVKTHFLLSIISHFSIPVNPNFDFLQ